MMPRWMTVTLRCWIAFIAFTNFGAAFRCFTDYNFVHEKFFGIENLDSITYTMKDGPFLERMYGFWSLINGIVLLCCFHCIEDKKIIGLSVCVITLYLIFFSLEGFLYKTVLIHGPTIYPFVLSAVTLVWLICGLICLSFPSTKEDYDENEILRKQFPFKSVSKKLR